jgi:hypothetical protein
LASSSGGFGLAQKPRDRDTRDRATVKKIRLGEAVTLASGRPNFFERCAEEKEKVELAYEERVFSFDSLKLSHKDRAVFEANKGSLCHGDVYSDGTDYRGCGLFVLWEDGQDFYCCPSAEEYGYSVPVFFGDLPSDHFEQSPMTNRWYHVDFVPRHHFIFDKVREAKKGGMIVVSDFGCGDTEEILLASNGVNFPQDFMWG